MVLRVAPAKVLSMNPDGSNPRWLGQLGHVSGLQWGFTLPGGPDSAALNFDNGTKVRDSAMNPGRIIKIAKGGSCVWDGKLNEAVYSSGGWQMTAHGSGTFGGEFKAGFTTYNLNDPINQAILRTPNGLRWVNPGIPAGWLVTSQPDLYSETVTDWLNNITIPAGLSWYIGRGNVLSTGIVPSSPNRILVSTDPAPRTITSDINRLFIKFVVSDDGQGNIVNGYTVASNLPSQLAHGTVEDTIDITAAGVMSSASAANIGATVLSNYQRAAFTNAFTIRYGQLRTMGGTAIDLATEQAATCCRLAVMDGGFGGEVIAGPVSFPTGQYTYFDDNGTAQLTPFQSFKTDISTLLGVLVPGVR